MVVVVAVSAATASAVVLIAVVVVRSLGGGSRFSMFKLPACPTLCQRSLPPRSPSPPPGARAHTAHITTSTHRTSKTHKLAARQRHRRRRRRKRCAGMTGRQSRLPVEEQALSLWPLGRCLACATRMTMEVSTVDHQVSITLPDCSRVLSCELWPLL
jgi:hypothetical protein